MTAPMFTTGSVPNPKTLNVVREFVAVYTHQAPQTVGDQDLIADDLDLRCELAGIVDRHYRLRFDPRDRTVFASVSSLAAAIDHAR